jgi:hypothetical protein
MLLAKRPRHRTKVFPTFAAAVADIGSAPTRPAAPLLVAALERFARRDA